MVNDEHIRHDGYASPKNAPWVPLSVPAMRRGQQQTALFNGERVSFGGENNKMLTINTQHTHLPQTTTTAAAFSLDGRKVMAALRVLPSKRGADRSTGGGAAAAASSFPPTATISPPSETESRSDPPPPPPWSAGRPQLPPVPASSATPRSCCFLLLLLLLPSRSSGTSQPPAPRKASITERPRWGGPKMVAGVAGRPSGSSTLGSDEYRYQ